MSKFSSHVSCALAVAFTVIAATGCDDPDLTIASDEIIAVDDGVLGVGLAAELDQLRLAEDDAEDHTDFAEFALDVLVDEGDDPEASSTYCNAVTNTKWASGWKTLESQVLTLVNQRRAAGATCGGVNKPPAPALTLNSQLRCAARKHSKDMGDKNFFSHTGSNGWNFIKRIEAAGYLNWLAAAENIAAGQTTAAAVVTGWMNSTGHCNNIMNPNYKHLGVGYYNKSTATYKHYWTQNFGRK